MKTMKLKNKPIQFACLLIVSSCLMGMQGQAAASSNPPKSPGLMRLDSDSTQLNTDMLALHTRLQDVHKTLNVTKHLLEVPGHVESDLKKLELSLQMLDKLLNVAEAIPQIRADAKRIKQEIEVVLKEVTAAKQVAQKAAMRAEPLRSRVEKADEQVVKRDADFEQFRMAVPNSMPAYTNIAQTCVNYSMPARKQCMQGFIDGKGGNADSGIQQLDKVVKLALTDIPDLSHLNNIAHHFDYLESIQKKVDVIVKDIESMVRPLKELDHLLDRHFTTSFPYPNPTWKNPVRISHYDIKVSMRIIMKGGNAIEDEIERVLSKSLWKAAKIFGVGKLVHSIKHEAEKEMDSLTSKLHLKPNLHIPGLGQFGDVISEMETEIAKIPADFGANIPHIAVTVPSLNYKGQLIDLNAIRKLTSDLAPHGIHGFPAALCAGVSYGCK